MWFIATPAVAARFADGIRVVTNPSNSNTGATFAAWIEYSSEGSYSLGDYHRDGELPMDYCPRYAGNEKIARDARALRPHIRALPIGFCPMTE